VGAPKRTDRFLTSSVGREIGGNREVGEVFHLSAGPTVTAGFNGFAFDIRIRRSSRSSRSRKGGEKRGIPSS
jgi:hypothetical protein